MVFILESMDKELLKIVFEDLEHITKEWNDKDISDANLRRSSDILRRLLIHDDLFKAARSFEMKKLRVLSSDEEYPSFPDAVLHQAGGGKFNGVQIKGFTIYNRALTPEEMKRSYKDSKKKKNKPVKLSKFLKRPSITIEGTTINREEIIKYVCNKLGGAHYDTRRKVGHTLEEKYKLLDKHKDSTELAGKKAIYFELLSIGQKLVNNKDVQKLKKKIKNYLNENVRRSP